MALERLTQITEVGIQSGITLRNVNVEGAYVSGVVTATSLNVTGSGANFSGVVTATSFNGNVTGNINPTSLNVSGVSTFGSNVFLGDGDIAYFGDGQDLLIFHNSTDSIIRDNGTGDLFIQGGNRVRITNPTGIETYAVFNQDGSSELWYDNVKRLETSGIGVSITSALTVGTGASISSPATNVLTLGTNNVERVRVDSGGNLGIGTASPNDKLHVIGNIRLDGNRFIQAVGGDLKLNTDSGNNVTLNINGSEKVRLSSSGLVGINSTSPTALLDVCDPTDTIGLMVGIKKTNGLMYFGRSTGYDYGTAYSTLNSFIGRADTAGNHITTGDGGLGSSNNQMVIGHNGTGGILLGTTDAGPYPSGRMLIDADGRISTPNQISFFQYAMSGSSFNSGTMTGGSSDHNVGGHYNTSTGIFTAPITGYYQFGCGVLVNSGSGRLEGYISKNNGAIVVNFNGTGTTFDGPSATCIFYLAANDNVRISRTSGTAYALSHGNHYFWGRLLG